MTLYHSHGAKHHGHTHGDHDHRHDLHDYTICSCGYDERADVVADHFLDNERRIWPRQLGGVD